MVAARSLRSVVTIALVAIVSVFGIWSALYLTVAAFLNVIEAPRNILAAAVDLAAALALPIAAVVARRLARRRGVTGRPLAWIVAGVVLGTVYVVWFVVLALPD